MSATNFSGRAGVLKVKAPTGNTLGYILLYTMKRRLWISNAKL